MKIKYGRSLGLGFSLVCTLMLMIPAFATGQAADNPKLEGSAKFPAPKISGFWQTSGPFRSVFIYGKHFQPSGEVLPVVKIGGEQSFSVYVLADDLLLVLPPTPQTKGSITVETRAGSPPKTIARAISSVKLGEEAKGFSIHGIWPDHGPTGTIVFVFGSGFEPNKTRVSISQTSAPHTQVITQGLLLALVPTGATSGSILVSADDKHAKSKDVFSME